MSSFYWGILIGLLLGCSVGVVVAALLTAAKRGECGPKIESWLADKTG